MRIEVLYFDGCPHLALADLRVREMVAETGVAADIIQVHGIQIHDILAADIIQHHQIVLQR